MAIFRLEVKILGRGNSKRGRSAVAAAAYRSGSKLFDAQSGTTKDYSRRAAGIAYTAILTPDAAPSWLRYDSREEERQVRQTLWNAVETEENSHNRRDSARLARELILALPYELSPEQRQALTERFARLELVSRGMVADVSLHEPKQSKNVHAHILLTLRPLDGFGFGPKERGWDKKELLLHWRKAWAEMVNDALADAGKPQRVDHRSLTDQGIDRLPQPKIGVAAMALERKGIRTERGKQARWADMENFLLPARRSLQTSGEVYQIGLGNSWWERAEAAFDPMEAAASVPSGGRSR